ncbi:FlgD immunoglobulin-like domain containing protein [Rosettibacter firmus]|uniref:FlgD immunoglobulin-like domain containing protein n=1 Tax=Rosettibacter firmus TaxID=3111522 RepID=UPI00336BF363
MKKIIILWIIFCGMVVYPQELILQKPVNKDNSKSYPIDPRPLLENFNRINGIDLNQPVQEENVLRKTTAWNFKVGDTKKWYASDFSSNQFYQVSSTCRAVGNFSYIFVEDALWNKNIDAESVQKILEAFEQKTPANSSKGIYQTNVETFGNPPNVDGDSKIIILVLDIKDGYSGSGGYVAGYFHAYHEYTTTQYPNSNKAEIYFLDGVQNNFETNDGVETALSTTAHEFQHMIHWNYIQGDETFFDEAWSLIAEVINGYPLYNQSYYANEPYNYLYGWRRDDQTAVLADYSRAARFALYLKEMFGTQIFKKYLEGKIKAANGLQYALTQLGYNKKFVDVLEDWYIANYLNNKNVNPSWGYSYPDLPKMKSIINYNPNVSATKNVFKYGVQYITFVNGKELNITFKNLGNNLKAKAIKIGKNSAKVENIDFNTDYFFSDFGTTYDEITFAIYMIDESESKTGPFNFTYEATGIFENRPIEIAYDYTEPVGVYKLSVGDTVAVVFNGIQGTKLDSFRVALRNMVPMQGGIWTSTNQKILATKLLGVTVAGKTTPAVINGNATYPYEQPYPNWVTVDLRSYNIETSSNFAIAFVIDGVYESSSSPTNRVMHTNIPGSSPYHSYTYLNEPSGGKEPGWYYIGDGTTISLYLIRAYVSYIISDNKEVVELVPASFALEQNYPNPFNPSTIISYQIPEMSKVQLIIYDAIGKEVRKLVDEIKPAGKYQITWDGKDNSGNRVSSGVYFYKIIAGNFVQTKKMILIK